jgi:hypothetical protein
MIYREDAAIYLNYAVQNIKKTFYWGGTSEGSAFWIYVTNTLSMHARRSSDGLSYPDIDSKAFPSFLPAAGPMTVKSEKARELLREAATYITSYLSWAYTKEGSSWWAEVHKRLNDYANFSLNNTTNNVISRRKKLLLLTSKKETGP